MTVEADDRVRDRRAPPSGSAKASMAPTVDLLDRAIERVRPDLDRSLPVARRLRALWAGVVAARNTGAVDVIRDAFMRLAIASGLAADLGRHADEDLRHVIRWGLLNRNPFWP